MLKQCLWFFILFVVQASALSGQIMLVDLEVIPADCSNNGQATIEISGGTPIYCYQLDGAPCQFSNQTTYTFQSLEVGVHLLTVSDATDSVSVQIVVTGSYTPPSVTCTVDACFVNVDVSDGKGPFGYAISQGGGPFSAYQAAPVFSSVIGDFCVRVVDDCNNIVEYCGVVDLEPIAFVVECCADAPAADALCVQISDADGRLPSEPSFNVGGLPPYTFSAVRPGEEVSSLDGSFTLPADCPTWSFKVKDVCGNEVQYEHSCISAEPLCVNCAVGDVELMPVQSVGVHSYFYLSDTGWLANLNGVNSHVFNMIQNSSTAVNGYAFQIENTCGAVSDTVFASCFSAVASFDCSLGEVSLEPDTEFFPVEVTCTTCLPVQSTTLQSDGVEIFPIGAGANTFELTNDCGEVLTLDCRDTIASLILRKSCNSIEAIYRSAYVCDGFDKVAYQNISSGVTYRLYLQSNPTQLLQENSEGTFYGLDPGVFYTVKAEHGACGLIQRNVRLFEDGDHNIEFELVPTAIEEQQICKKAYDITIQLDNPTGVAPRYSLWDANGNVFDSIEAVENILPGTWVLATENYCDTVSVVLPEWETDMEVDLPICANNRCVEVQGGKKGAVWTQWGQQNGFGMRAKSDYYTMNCIDKNPNICKRSVAGRFCNFPLDSLHYVYLFTNKGACPVDTLSFNLGSDSFSQMDSFEVSAGITCDVTQPTSVEVRVVGGVQPIIVELVDSNTGQIIETFEDLDADNRVEITDLYIQEAYEVRISDSCGGSLLAPVQVYDLPSIALEYEFLCDGAMRLGVNLPFSGYTWKDVQGAIIGVDSDTSDLTIPAPVVPTTYVAEFNIQSCPPFELSIDVPVYTAPEVSLPASGAVLCNTDSVILTTETGIGDYTYLWSTGDTTASIAVRDADTYQVIATNEFACSDSASVFVPVSSPIQADFMLSHNPCHGDSLGSIEVLPMGGVPPFDLDWGHGPTAGFIEDLAAGIYELTIEDSLGCIVMHRIEVEEPSDFVVFLPSQQEIRFGEEIKIRPDLVGTDSVTWQWYPDTQIDCPTCGTTLFQPFVSTTYTVVATDSAGCTAENSVHIQVDGVCEAVVPNALSLSANDYNSFVRLFPSPCIEEVLDFSLFDRWGTRMGQRRAFVPQSDEVLWDGHINGKTAEVGVYVWVLRCRLVDGRIMTWSGDVTLVD